MSYTDVAFWIAATLFVASVAMLQLRARGRSSAASGLPEAGLVMVAFLSCVWVIVAALCPRRGGLEAPAVASGAGKAVAAVVLLVVVACAIPMAVYLALEWWSASWQPHAALPSALSVDGKTPQTNKHALPTAS